MIKIQFPVLTDIAKVFYVFVLIIGTKLRITARGVAYRSPGSIAIIRANTVSSSGGLSMAPSAAGR